LYSGNGGAPQVLFAARRERVASGGASWFGREYLRNAWHSDIVLGTFKGTGDVVRSMAPAHVEGSSIGPGVDAGEVLPFDKEGGKSTLFDTLLSQNLLSLVKAQKKHPQAQVQVGTVLRSKRSFRPCVSPAACNANGTVAVKVTTGPEDPRIFSFAGATYVSMFSYDNVIPDSAAHSNNSALLDAYHRTDYYGDYGTHSEVCRPSPADGLIGRMYIARLHSVQINPCMVGDFQPVMPQGLSLPDYSIVKNWLAFSYSEWGSADRLFFIHQISPVFVVMEATAGLEAPAAAAAAASVGPQPVTAVKQYSSRTPQEILGLDRQAAATYDASGGNAFTLVRQERRVTDGDGEGDDVASNVVYLSPQQLAYQTAHAAELGLRIEELADPDGSSSGGGGGDGGDSDGTSFVHGSANPVFVDSGASRSGRSYYLSAFHTVSNDTYTNYAAYAFAFCPSPPFRISAVSPRLWLNLTTSEPPAVGSRCDTAPFAFISGMMLGSCGGASGGGDDDSAAGDDCLLISYGVCDVESKVAVVNLKEFEKTFKTVRHC
jgi:hypothetical protein